MEPDFLPENDEIRVKPRPDCPVCGSSGAALHKNWRDRILNIPGSWTWKRCFNKKCCTVWQDPVVIEQDLPKLYVNYPTHNTASDPLPYAGLLQRVRDAVRDSYLHRAYQYPSQLPSWIRSFLYYIACVHIAWKDTQAASIFYLPFKRGGVVLDVGCGNGSSLKALERRGWKGVGIDFDESAISIARAKGLEVYAGDLQSQSFPASSFDAVIMNHVVEHVPAPYELLQECKRVLKKDGILIAITPNAASRGHEKYGSHWRGYEPDHLQLYTPASLHMLGAGFGFTRVETFSSLQGVNYLLDSSENLSHQKEPEPRAIKGFIPKLRHQARWLFLGLLHQFSPGRDEVAVLRCVK